MEPPRPAPTTQTLFTASSACIEPPSELKRLQRTLSAGLPESQLADRTNGASAVTESPP
jgi:hypothetical protein